MSGRTPIQWHVVNEGQVPQQVLGDHVYFTPSGIYVNNQLGQMQRVTGAKVNNTLTSTAVDEALSANMGKELKGQIDVLKNSKDCLTVLGKGDGAYDIATKPSDYKANALTIAKLRKEVAVGAKDGGFWISLLGLKTHGANNCYEFGFTDAGNMLYRKSDTSNDSWAEWKQIPIPEKADIALNGVTAYITAPQAFICGNSLTIDGMVQLAGPITDGTVIGTLPAGFRTGYNFHVYLHSATVNLPYNARLLVSTDGNIKIYGCSAVTANTVIEFNKTVII